MSMGCTTLFQCILSLELQYELKHVDKLKQVVENCDITFTKEDLDKEDPDHSGIMIPPGSSSRGRGHQNVATTGGAEPAYGTTIAHDGDGGAVVAPGPPSTKRKVKEVRGAGVARWAEKHGSSCRVLTITSANIPKYPAGEAIANHCYRLEKLSAADNSEIDDELAIKLCKKIFDSNGQNSKLEKLFLNGTSVTDAGCGEFLKYCPNLHMLALSRSKFSDIGAKAVSENCRELKVLGVNSCGLTDKGVRDLLYVTRTTCTTSSTSDDGFIFAGAPEGDRIVVHREDHDPHQDHGPRAAPRPGETESLNNVDRTGFSEQEPETGPAAEAVLLVAANTRTNYTRTYSTPSTYGSSNLHTFKLADTPITDDACTSIAVSLNMKLKTLHLFKCDRVTDQGIRVVAENCQNLEEIDLHGLQFVTDLSAHALADNCPHLKRFYLSDTSITARGLNRLLEKENAVKIMRLEAKNCVFEEAERKALREKATVLSEQLQLVL
ncbi:unnamed protein product [Amoebophrya sp. A120]|nr:unnamed protein product [Amoebophrya sp. A120]|eukprot:GSA120T00012415001.1